MANEAEAQNLMRFFKTGPGEYGEGDVFLGLKVPVTRSLVREYRKEATVSDVRRLLESRFHEVRLCGFLLLIEIYNRDKRRETVDFYLSMIDRGNNWDLVDLVAPKILGDWLVSNPEERAVLDSLADMEGRLWHQRVAIVATFALIRAGEYGPTLRIAERFLAHEHDLIHKASGWILREMGKRGGLSLLLEFLERYGAVMPRTMLRYAIERLPEEQRQYFLRLKY